MTTRVLGVASLLSITVFLFSCGAQENGTAAQGNGAGAKKAAGIEPALAMANTLPALVAHSTYQSRETLVQAVYGATKLSGRAAVGRAVNTGTLTQVGRFGRFTYSPEPRDKLVVRLPAVTHEFRVKDVKGDMRAASPAAFLSANHALRYRHRVPGMGDHEIEITQVGQAFKASIEGSFTFEKRDYVTKMKADGTSDYQSGFGGFESRGDYRLTGEVTREGMRLTVNERHAFIMVSQGKSAAHQATDTSDNILKLGDDTYTWKNVKIIKVFRDGKPSYPHRDWKASGEVLKNGKLFGKYKLGRKSMPRDHKFKHRGMVLIQLTTRGEPINLQSFNLY